MSDNTSPHGLRECREAAQLRLKDVAEAIERDLPVAYHASISTIGRWEQLEMPVDPVLGLYLARLYAVAPGQIDPGLPEAIDKVRDLVKIAGVRLNDLLAA